MKYSHSFLFLNQNLLNASLEKYFCRAFSALTFCTYHLCRSGREISKLKTEVYIFTGACNYGYVSQLLFHISLLNMDLIYLLLR